MSEVISIQMQNSWSDTVGIVIDVTSGLLTAGGFFFPEIKPAAGAVSTVGGIIKKLVGELDPKPDPVMDKLNDLEANIDKLGTKMAAYFDDMKEFITEVNFLTNVVMPTSNLMKHMQDCMKHPNRAALENFQAAYESKKPLSIAYDMLSLLEHRKTNPLKMAMETDPLRTTVTFDEWYKKIGAALGQFYFLELFASGLLKEEDEKQMFDSEMLNERSEELYRDMEGWKNEYKKESTYWPNLQKVLQDEINNSPELDSKQKADQLKDKLSTILTNDSFYILTKPRKESLTTYFTMPDSVRNQHVFLDGKGKYQAFIWRHFPDISYGQQEYDYMINSLEHMFWLETMLGLAMFQPQTRNFINVIPNAGFAIMTYQENNEERVVNCAKSFVFKKSFWFFIPFVSLFPKKIYVDFFMGII
ncbi:unnamed protein product [Caenorhabditis nigoni]